MLLHTDIVATRNKEHFTDLLVRVSDTQLSNKLKKYVIGGTVSATVEIKDPRLISSKQQRKFYAIVGDIARHTGQSPFEVEDFIKYAYCRNNNIKMLSLSDCSVSTAREIISFLLEVCFYWEIPLKNKGLDLTEDIQAYLYGSLKHRKCALCGQKGEVHHWDAIGMGSDRKTVDDSSHRKICLCRGHHREAHGMGRETFAELHKVTGIIYEDVAVQEEDYLFWSLVDFEKEAVE